MFETVAHAAEAGAPAGGAMPYADILLIVAFIAIFYFLIWRPQSKRQKDHRNLMSSLTSGDEIVTAGGLVGQITRVEDDFIMCKFGDHTEMRVQKNAVVATLPKGTLKSLNEK